MTVCVTPSAASFGALTVTAFSSAMGIRIMEFFFSPFFSSSSYGLAAYMSSTATPYALAMEYSVCRSNTTWE